MALRVVQWATGTVGVHAAPAIARHRDLELVGLWVHSPQKVGRDAGEICGVEPLGVTATDDRQALIDLRPDAISYMAHSDVRPDQVIEDLCGFLRAGINVVNTSYVPLLYPPAAGPGVEERLAEACREGGASIYTSGIDPGFGNLGITVHSMALCEEIRHVRMMEIVNYATWDNPFTMFEIMGFGKTEPSQSLLLSPGSTALAWGPVVEAVAAAMGLELDRVEEWHEVLLADRDVLIASGTVPAGTISAMHFEIRGMVGDEAVVVVEHVTRLDDEQAPHWPQGSGYRILIEGEPSVKVELEVSSARGDHNIAGCLGTAMHVVNAIPRVVAADPGVLTYLDVGCYTAAWK